VSVSTNGPMLGSPPVGSGKRGRITREDVRARLQRLQGGVDEQVADKKKTALSVGAGVAVAIIMIFFLLGRRSGKKKSTIVEIRRV
jgi:hypothetical protein